MLETLKLIVRKRADSLRFNRGLERETLRTNSEGQLSLTPHPVFLGSKLSHPYITTDFSESQLELITPVSGTVSEAMTQLHDIHRYVYSALGDQLLWPASMPCELPDADRIPLARYGTSNLARLKTTYRHGLGLRYGRPMQTICAIHYNFSFPDEFWEILNAIEQSEEHQRDYRSRRYFDLMRNFRRLSWLPTYLFGASPAVSRAFLTGKRHNLLQLDNHTWFRPNATSLRNGGLGYQSDTQTGLVNICYNSLDEYVRTLTTAICSRHQDYTQLGGNETDDFVQVNANILQSEAEFYTSIRAKRVPADGANLPRTLHEQGVEYIEVRLLDVNPYAPVGIDEDTIIFLDLLLLYCVLSPSPVHDDALCAAVNANMTATVQEGRSSAHLDNQGQSVSLTEWGTETLLHLQQIAILLDAAAGQSVYEDTIKRQQRKLINSELTPSALMLADMQDCSFHDLALNRAAAHRDYFLAQPLKPAEIRYFQELAAKSNDAQKLKEAEAGPTFAQYLRELQGDYEFLLREL